MTKDQHILISDLTSSHSLIIFQRKGYFEPNGIYEIDRLPKIVEFIHKNYYRDKVLPDFYLYLPYE